MTLDEALLTRVRDILGEDQAITERRMFGGLAFLFLGNMGVVVGGQGGLMLRIDPEDVSTHVESVGAARAVMRGRELDGWITVDAETVVDDAALAHWVEVGAARARSLPPKGA